MSKSQSPYQTRISSPIFARNSTNSSMPALILFSVTKTFAITIGPRGSIIFDGKNLYTIPATEEKPIDTLGAGDMYAGAFLYAITSGMSWAAAGKLANLTSSKVVTLFGPRVDKQHTTELLEALNTQRIEAA